ncbi:hypothetical protein [Thiospirillum jenense]|uniref:Thymidylate synthase (FAD) n=1 Tax=Thiospirillum jenense TaxID=1653858 RepID=A0A839HEP5_9GAMM|nr:hypothetical protein [Thiospirillum jenense]MBB1125499.1 hypothetical protein [Thiospirillum jenense]
MRVTAIKLTDEVLMRTACDFTRDPNAEPSKMTLDRMYQCEHSPMRTQLFWIEMHQIPTFVSVHLVRHNVGVTHFVQSKRDQLADRNTPINHAMLINAQELVNMSRKRLCKKSADETRHVWKTVKNEIAKIDYALAERMVADCIYRGKCHELNSCMGISYE